MRNKNFVIRAVNILIIVAALLYYNQVLSLHQELDKANAAIEAMSQTGESAQTAQGNYTDGTYQGSAQGYGGTVTVEVTIENGNMTNIEVISADGEDAAYYNMAIDVLDSIMEKQSADDIDVVSGATYSSNGIIGAAKEALGKAGK
ncbi:FMN-binding protein [bacterium 210820-DFI.6.37]|nr:FMN-binding protein [bacterium 210820-DFI.6.37]